MWKIITIFLIIKLVSSEIKTSIDNCDNCSWVAHNQNRSIVIHAKVPGGIYSDLQRAGLLDSELFYRFNDIEYRWVAEESWTYATTFNVSSNILNKKVINLVFHGLDTVGTVLLNGKILGKVANMFVRYVFPIKDFVTEIDNVLEIRFLSPISSAEEQYQQQAKNYTIPPECVPETYHGECHVNFLRKMQASFSWDWGPAFPSVGIWKPVEIEAYDSAIIRDVTTFTKQLNDTAWKVHAKVYIESAEETLSSHTVKAHILTRDKKTKISRGVVIDTTRGRHIKSYVSIIEFQLNNTVQLWWPNGFGEQALYVLSVKVTRKKMNESSKKKLTFGIRTIELVQEELKPNMFGLSFYFKVNGVPIFAKGSNFIPGDVLPERGYNKDKIRHIMLSAKEAHMNMLRVWGGGVYESDYFYKLADQYGILIWQDMMFACAMYPTNEEFLSSVEVEIEQQIRRLQHHPSIAIWAGNNENEAALRGNWYGTAKDFNTYKRDYIELYVRRIQTVIEANDPSGPFVTSSPSNGLDTIAEDYVAQDPYSPLYGDVHYYNYLKNPWHAEQYPDTRFASEYGFQGLPSTSSLLKVAKPDDLKLDSQFTNSRQHLPFGNAQMGLMIAFNFKLPENDGSLEFYRTFIHLSQINQAMGTKTETEKYRRDRSKLTEENLGNTMGALYWQLNDVWQAPSWSSIEYGGRWKMIHYFAKKFFSPILISPLLVETHDVNLKEVNKTLQVFLISDLLEDIEQAEVTVAVYSWDSFDPRKVISTFETLKNATSSLSSSRSLSDLLTEAECSVDTCFLYFTLTAGNFLSNNILYLSPFHSITNLQKSNITTVVTAPDPTEIIITLQSDNIAPFVWLETDVDGHFSDNGFTMVNSSVVISFANWGKDIDVEEFQRTLIVQKVEKF